MNRKWKALTMLGLFLPAVILRASPARSFSFATEYTQLLNNVQLAHQTLQQAEELANQLKILNNMVQNIKNIPDQIWTLAFRDLQSLMNVVKQGQALAFSMSNVSEEFERKFKGFVQAANFQADYKKWSETVRDSIRSSLSAANIQSQQFSSEEAVLSRLRSMSQSAVGRMQAIQVGAQIAGEQVAQLQKLRALIMAQMQAQNAYMAGQQQLKDNVKAAEENFFKYSNPSLGKTYKEF